MSRSVYPSSGPEGDDASEVVDYDNEMDLKEISADDDSDNDLERRARRRGWKQSSSSSQQVNTIKQSASNARVAASAAAANTSSSSSAAEGDDLRLATLTKRLERKLAELSKRERELAEREKAASSKSSKRHKSSNSSKRSTDSASSSESDVSGDSGDDSDGNGKHAQGRGSSSSKSAEGKDITLRQDAIINKFPMLSYVDISVFSRANLNVRKSKGLVPISSSAEYSAAWASFNVALQQYLINASRSDDALMVSKYYSQIVRLLTDYSSQWHLVMEFDGYIRGNTSIVDDHTVWSIDRDDDYVSQFKYDIRFKHQDASRIHTTQRSAPAQARRSGGNTSNTTSSNKSRNVCYAYNGLNSSTNEWSNSSHCRNADRCKFSHKCLHCKVEGHAIYERAECAANPRVLPAPRQTARRP
jgi:hypothetical protein